MVGQGACLTLHGTDQTWKVRLSSKQWMEFECHMSRWVCAWGIGANVAKLLQTKPKGNACKGSGVFSLEKRAEYCFGIPVAFDGRTEASR